MSHPHLLPHSVHSRAYHIAALKALFYSTLFLLLIVFLFIFPAAFFPITWSYIYSIPFALGSLSTIPTHILYVLGRKDEENAAYQDKAEDTSTMSGTTATATMQKVDAE